MDYLIYLWKNPLFFEISVEEYSYPASFSKKNQLVGENEPHIRIPAAFTGPRWDKLGGKITLI
jgi:hypothetical protein